jgi:hypothetical protein
VSFGPSITFYLLEIGYCNPGLIILYGQLPDGELVELVQHISQISILFTKLPKQGEARKPFGFAGGVRQQE